MIMSILLLGKLCLLRQTTKPTKWIMCWVLQLILFRRNTNYLFQCVLMLPYLLAIWTSVSQATVWRFFMWYLWKASQKFLFLIPEKLHSVMWHGSALPIVLNFITFDDDKNNKNWLNIFHFLLILFFFEEL